MRTIRLLSERQANREIKRRIAMLPLMHRAGSREEELVQKCWIELVENRHVVLLSMDVKKRKVVNDDGTEKVVVLLRRPQYRSDEIKSACDTVRNEASEHDGRRRDSIESSWLEGCEPSNGTLDPMRVVSAIEQAVKGLLRYVSREASGRRIGTNKAGSCSSSEARRALYGD